jgi:uncharacterized protein YraI
LDNTHKIRLIVIILFVLSISVMSHAQQTRTGHIAVELNVRSGPGTNHGKIGKFQPGTDVIIEGRSNSGSWIVVQSTNGNLHGWVSASYVDFDKSLIDMLPITNITFEVPETVIEYTEAPVNTSTISGIGSRTRQIFRHGQSLGNRPNVFSKVGDSLTDNPYMFESIGWGNYALHEFEYLQPVISYFTEIGARDGNSFVNRSMAAKASWTTFEVFDAGLTDPAICHHGESPLECEYKVVKPSIALILIGTNDMALNSIWEYQYNLTLIVQISIDNGVIPVLSTIPDRLDEDVSAFNNVIKGVAYEYGVPLWDLWSELQSLPNRGRVDDNIHLSYPPGNIESAVDFRAEHLQYGYVIRNLGALQVLDAIWRQVLVGE